jgi:hypothetical protein
MRFLLVTGRIIDAGKGRHNIREKSLSEQPPHAPEIPL